MKTADNGYELIPMSEITDEAREIAVRWMECDDKNWIGQKHKLASDIMNYAKKYVSQFQQGYPREFVEWKDGFAEACIDKTYYCEPKIIENRQYVTLDELYEYWKLNIKDK